ncbi:hypothetical protein LR48_Vigan07g198700 [Vigna angularis]|uniref:Uncharacterized protein n=1 Tax=Phaseolus angularis TaxID=3914 RepID=A0A0L9UZS7_PHAAN|nr:hypothetical protein LR48_Vigan07g198700 [Vigna angularis]
MADSRRPCRRAVGASLSKPRAPHLASIDGWIFDQEKHADFANFWQERRIMAAKFIRLDFYRFCGFQFPDLFGAQGLTHLVEQKCCIYPDLIRVFYFNVKYRDGIFTTKPSNPFSDILNNKSIAINSWWGASRILEHKGVSVVGEHTQAIQSIGTEIGETTFRQMGFVACGCVILHKDDENQEAEDDDMDAHMTKPVGVAAPSEVVPSTMPASSSLSLSMEEYFANLSKQLEDMSLAHQARFDELIEMQQTHEEYAIEKFDDFDTRLGNIENRLNLHPLKKPPSPEF